MSGHSMTADEVAQEALIRAWMRWSSVSRLDRPEGWLYVTALRLMRRRLKRKASRPDPPTIARDGELDDTDEVQ